jgi:nucleoside diphosphate kinase
MGSVCGSPGGAEPRPGDNDALVFVKPHACNAQVVSAVRAFLAEHGVSVVSSGEISGPQIDKEGIIDAHYAHIAKVAMKLSASSLPVSADKKGEFASKFGKGSWDELASSGQILNLREYAAKTGKGFKEIEDLWRATSAFKLAPGTYVAWMADGGVFVLNAFYGMMRSIYTVPDAKVMYLIVRWSESKLSWADFRGKVIGATDPSKAVEGSLRNKIMREWKELGLASEPNTGNNGVHASAGPVEGLRERMVWVGATLEADAFGKAALAAGVKRKLLDSWLNNDRVKIGDKEGNAFDLLEDINSSEAIRIALEASSKL